MTAPEKDQIKAINRRLAGLDTKLASIDSKLELMVPKRWITNTGKAVQWIITTVIAIGLVVATWLGIQAHK